MSMPSATGGVDMYEPEFDHLVLRYLRQIIMQTMDHIRSGMREENIPYLRHQSVNPHVQKSAQNLTMAIDQEA